MISRCVFNTDGDKEFATCIDDILSKLQCVIRGLTLAVDSPMRGLEGKVQIYQQVAAGSPSHSMEFHLLGW
jgi:hypothetical protein